MGMVKKYYINLFLNHNWLFCVFNTINVCLKCKDTVSNNSVYYYFISSLFMYNINLNQYHHNCISYVIYHFIIIKLTLYIKIIVVFSVTMYDL